MLKSSEAVRRRTKAAPQTQGVLISQGGIKKRLNFPRYEICAEIIRFSWNFNNSENPQDQGSAVTKEDHKLPDPVLDSLVEGLKLREGKLRTRTSA